MNVLIKEHCSKILILLLTMLPYLVTTKQNLKLFGEGLRIFLQNCQHCLLVKQQHLVLTKDNQADLCWPVHWTLSSFGFVMLGSTWKSSKVIQVLPWSLDREMFQTNFRIRRLSYHISADPLRVYTIRVFMLLHETSHWGGGIVMGLKYVRELLEF